MMSIDEGAAVSYTLLRNPVPLVLMEDGLSRGSILELSTIDASLVCIQCPEGRKAGDNDG